MLSADGSTEVGTYLQYLRACFQHPRLFIRIALVENENRLKQAVRQLDRALNKGIKAPTGSKLKKRPQK